jgi:hypothetical protein
MPALPSCRRRHASPRRTLLPLHRSYGLMRQTAALLSPLTLPLAPGLCRLLSAPAAQRLFPTLSLPIYPYVSGPLLRWPSRCNFPFLPLRRWPSPRLNRVGASQSPQQLLPLGSKSRSCSHSLMFRPARLLATPVAPTLTPFGAGQPWLLHPRISRFVTSPRSGYANRPNRVIGGKVGIEVWRAQPLRVRWLIHRFPNGPQSGSHHAHVSTSPPFHPGRSDVPSPVGDHDYHCSLPTTA